MRSKANWTQQEDLFLRNHVCIGRKNNWIQISKQLNNQFPDKHRNSKQCRERYVNHASISQENQLINAWQPHQIVRLFTVFHQVGPKWTKISDNFYGKTENSVKNKFYGCLRKFIRNLDIVGKKNQKKKYKGLKYSSVCRILQASDNFKALKQQLKQRSLDIRNEIIQILIGEQIQQIQVVSQQQKMNLVQRINKFNLDSRNYKNERNKLTKIQNVKNVNHIQSQKQNQISSTNILNEKQMIVYDLKMFESLEKEEFKISEPLDKIQTNTKNSQNNEYFSWENTLLNDDEIIKNIANEFRIQKTIEQEIEESIFEDIFFSNIL